MADGVNHYHPAMMIAEQPIPRTAGHWRALPGSRLSGALAALVCLLAGGYLAARAHDEAILRHANELGLRHQYKQAITLASPLVGTPSALGALLVEANAYSALGRYSHAASLFSRASSLAPRDWQIRSDWAAVLLALGARQRAAQQLSIARTLNPRLLPTPGPAVSAG